MKPEDRKEMINIFNQGFEEVVMPHIVKIYEEIAEIREDHGFRLTKIEETLDQHSFRLDRIDARLDRMDERFDRMDERFDRVDERFDRVERKLNSVVDRQDEQGFEIKRIKDRLAE